MRKKAVNKIHFRENVTERRLKGLIGRENLGYHKQTYFPPPVLKCVFL